MMLAFLAFGGLAVIVALALGRPKVTYVEARCVGGGSEVNAGLFYRTPADVIERWRREFAVDALDPDSLAMHFEAIEKALREVMAESHTRRFALFVFVSMLAYSAQDCVIRDPKLDLEVATREQKKYLLIVKDCEYQDSLDSGTLFLQTLLNYQGRTDSRYSMNDGSFDEEGAQNCVTYYYDGDRDSDGCPDRVVRDGHTRLEVLEKIYFETDRARILPRQAQPGQSRIASQVVSIV